MLLFKCLQGIYTEIVLKSSLYIFETVGQSRLCTAEYAMFQQIKNKCFMDLKVWKPKRLSHEHHLIFLPIFKSNNSPEEVLWFLLKSLIIPSLLALQDNWTCCLWIYSLAGRWTAESWRRWWLYKSRAWKVEKEPEMEARQHHNFGVGEGCSFWDFKWKQNHFLSSQRALWRSHYCGMSTWILCLSTQLGQSTPTVVPLAGPKHAHPILGYFCNSTNDLYTSLAVCLWALSEYK